MAIATLIIGILAFVISIIALLGLGIVFNTLIDQKSNSYAPNNTIKSDESEYDKGYHVGSNGIWNAVQLAVFDMFREADIFDYEGTMENLTSKVSKVISNEQFRTKLHSDLDEYMKRTDNDPSDDY